MSLRTFASAEGKKGGQFYTPSWVVRVLVEALAPYKGRVYDPCCGSGGMFVSSEKFIEAHSGKVGDISIYGQESNYTKWRLATYTVKPSGGTNIIAPTTLKGSRIAPSFERLIGFEALQAWTDELALELARRAKGFPEFSELASGDECLYSPGEWDPLSP